MLPNLLNQQLYEFLLEGNLGSWSTELEVGSRRVQF